MVLKGIRLWRMYLEMRTDRADPDGFRWPEGKEFERATMELLSSSTIDVQCSRHAASISLRPSRRQTGLSSIPAHASCCAIHEIAHFSCCAASEKLLYVVAR